MVSVVHKREPKNMAFPIFLSVVCIVRNQASELRDILDNTAKQISSYVSDYELIVIDNASEDGSVDVLKELTKHDGLPNLQVYALTTEVNTDVGTLVGLENALGDYIAIVDPLADDISFLPKMLDEAVSGAEVVFAKNKKGVRQSYLYRGAYAIFNGLYRFFNGINLQKEAPRYRVLSRHVVNFILQHAQPFVTYRHLPATGGFKRINLEYSAPPALKKTEKLWRSIDRGMRLLVSTTQTPMRLVTTLSLFSAGANLFYSIYVLLVGFLKSDVAPGWVSLSLQQSGMFFLISLVLLVLGEYILQMVNLTNEGPLYHIAQEFTSERMTRKEKKNIEVVSSSGTPSNDSK